jgi:exo-beta-1,3-glucanase (GH17 family)
MNQNVTSAFRSVAPMTALGACLTLAACSTGTDQNWEDAPSYVTIGGTVSGLTGAVSLQNNGQDDLPVTANGEFTFGLSIANGKPYSVTVRSQPIGQVCRVTNGTGTATANVTSVAVDCKSDVTIGGTISGLVGTVILQNNGGNSLATASNGAFTFTTAIAHGSTYSVTVRTQPLGQTCSVANGAGTATANVTNVAVECAAFTLRPLPAIYSTGKAINYSPYRAGGPGAGEMPTDAQVLEDLGLLRIAGYDLLRLFGGDAVSEKILRLARDNYPEMQFHQGIYLKSVGDSCVDAVNDAQVATTIRLANTYDNVATVSVGNETSFFSSYMPMKCLEGYINKVRSSVPQPVTADDDYTFYAGLTYVGGDRNGARPDTILPLLDFVSIHMYPISNSGQWDWRQAAVPAGPARAEAMMNAALANAKASFDAVAAYEYLDETGARVSIGESLPIVVGETGWKAVQTNPASAIEAAAANPVNAKWYADLLYGNPANGLPSWERSAGGPVAIFYFEATDEAWKGTDDGWGLWDSDRTARYALCGTPAGPACAADLYEGAGYFGSATAPVIAAPTPPAREATDVLSVYSDAYTQIAGVDLNPAWGQTTVVSEVAIAGNDTLKYATFNYQGIDFSGSPIDVSAMNRLHVDVWTPDVATLMVSIISAGAENAVTLTPAAAGWNSYDIPLALYTVPNKAAIIQLKFEGTPAGGTAYLDNIYFWKGAAGGGLPNGVWASNYTQVDGSNWTSAEGGAAGRYIDTSVPTLDWWNGVAPDDTPPSFYFGYGINVATKPWGFGAYVSAPGNGSPDLSGYANAVVTVWGNPELMNTNPTLTLLLKGPDINGCTAELQGSIAVAASGPQTYTVPLNSFALQTACTYASVAEVLAAGIAQFHIQVLGANVQYVTTDDAQGNYPNGLNIGPITFN